MIARTLGQLRNIMGQVLVRKLEDKVIERLRAKAKASGRSLEEFARAALRKAAEPSPEEVWAEIDRFRARIGPLSGDSTAMIREDRDNDEPYR
jgi:plasmid stability protein